jgi:hypothetical protein
METTMAQNNWDRMPVTAAVCEPVCAQDPSTARFQPKAFLSPALNQRENRHFAAETKFILSAAQAGQVREWARIHLAADPCAAGDTGDTYRITSLYFDTRRFDVFHRRGSYGRSKFRIRRYDESPQVFLERKLKTNGMVTKRRSLVPVEELGRLCDAEAVDAWVGHWYRLRVHLRQFHPACQITYRRMARVAMTERGPIRLTLDEGLRAIETHTLAYQDVNHGVPLLEGQFILELKYLFAVPLVFKLLIEEFALNPQPVSKYRLAINALGLANRAGDLAATLPTESPSLCLNS